MSNPLDIFARELRANLILFKFQMSVFIAFYSFLNAFILCNSLITRMFCQYKDATIADGLSKNHSDMIFSVNRWSKSRKTCCSKKPLEPEIVHTSQCVPFFGIYCPFSSLMFTFWKRCHVMEGNTQALELDQLDLSRLSATLTSVELWISYLSSLSFLLQLKDGYLSMMKVLVVLKTLRILQNGTYYPQEKDLNREG